MIGEFERAVQGTIGKDKPDNSELIQAMIKLLMVLLSNIGDASEETEEGELSKELTDRIRKKYNMPSSKANQLIPMPS